MYKGVLIANGFDTAVEELWSLGGNCCKAIHISSRGHDLRQASMNLGCESHSLVKKMKEMGASQNLNEYLFTVDNGWNIMLWRSMWGCQTCKRTTIGSVVDQSGPFQADCFWHGCFPVQNLWISLCCQTVHASCLGNSSVLQWKNQQIHKTCFGVWGRMIRR